jgi:5-methylcytosine-specific restriction endonuclease McrA
MTRWVGVGNALYLLETGEEIDAHRALAMGLLQEVIPAGGAVDRALAIAERITGYPQTSLRADRDSVLAAPGRPLEEGLASEALSGRAAETDDLRRASAGSWNADGERGRRRGRCPSSLRRPARPHVFGRPSSLRRRRFRRRLPDSNYTPVFRSSQASARRKTEDALYNGRGGCDRLGRSLVLNATFEPLAVVTARRAVVLVLKDKAEILESNGMVFRSEKLSVPAPSVVRLQYFVKVPYRARASLTRRAVFARDGWICQYCGKTAENVDHVIPRSRGGSHSWENVVASCRRCNAKKENHLHQEVGLKLRRHPYAPRDGLRLSLGRLEPEWEPYLARTNGHKRSSRRAGNGHRT